MHVGKKTIRHMSMHAWMIQTIPLTLLIIQIILLTTKYKDPLASFFFFFETRSSSFIKFI